MMRFPRRVVVATHNRGKRAELSRLLERHGIEWIDAADVGVSEPDEPANTFEGNAIVKVQHATRMSGLPSIADDTGICVDALAGGPGVHTKPWAMERGGWTSACRALCEELGLVRDPASGPFAARFVCAMALAWPAEHAPVSLVARGEALGRLRWPPDAGPGFVPVFAADDAEAFEHEGVYAHRERAFMALWDLLSDR